MMTTVVSIQSRNENKNCFHCYDTTQFANNDDKQKKNKLKKHQKNMTLPSPSKAKKLTKCALLCQPTTTKLQKNVQIDSRSFHEIKTSLLEIMMKMLKEKFSARKKGQA